MSQTVTVKIDGDVKDALAKLDLLGLKAEEAGVKTEAAFGDKLGAQLGKTTGIFGHLSQTLESITGLPFGEAFNKASTPIEKADISGKKFNDTMQTIGKVSLVAGAAGLGYLASQSLKLGANFQEGMTSLVTGAGESEDAIGKVSAGILKLSPEVAESTQQLTSGMYMIESAGFHGASGLTVLKAAAQGAKTGNADLGTVANAVTTVLNSYKLGAGAAATVTSKLVETVASGKTHMQDLASAMATVTPAAATVHLSLDQVLGAMATMTAAGTPAADAATYLKQTILQISNPTAKAANEMQSMGLNAVDLAKNLGARGLTGTLQIMENAIIAHMGPAGTVLIDSLKKAATGSTAAQKAVQNLNDATQELGPALTKIAQGYEHGTVSAANYKAAVAKLTPEQQALMKKVASLTQTVDANASTSVSALDRIIHNVPPAQQTYIAAFANMVGGTRTMQAALELTGQHAATFAGNVENIAKTTADAHGNVQGFSKVQKDMNFQLESAKDSALAVGTEIGMKLIPIVQKFMKILAKVTTYLMEHKAILIAIAAVIGGVVMIAIGAFIVNGIQKMIDGVAQAGDSIMKLITKMGLFRTAEEEGAATSEATGGGFGPIGIAIGAIVLAITLLATHWKEVWDGIKKVAGDVGNFLKKWWPEIAILFTGGISMLVKFLMDHWQQIWHDIQAVWNMILGFLKRWWTVIIGVFGGPIGIIIGLIAHFHTQIWNEVQRLVSDVENFFTGLWRSVESTVYTGIMNVVHFFENLPQLVINAVGGLLSDMVTFGENIVHMIVKGIGNVAGDIGHALVSGLKSAGSHIPVIGGLISHLATGGIVTSPTLAVVGEAGPEMVLPLSQIGLNPSNLGANGVQPLPPNFASGASSTAPSSVGMTNYFQFVTTADANDIARETTWSLQRLVG